MNISPDDDLINLGHSIMALLCLEMHSDLCKAIDSSWEKKREGYSVLVKELLLCGPFW